jgi:hypothetical protein
MQFYRFMAAVRAGAGQPQRVPGQRGIVTIWVQAESAEAARSRAEKVLRSHDYDAAGELTGYLEQESSAPPTPERSPADQPPPIAAGTAGGYEAVKHAALDRGDGLFEVWLPEAEDPQPGRAASD